jgi:hypothetical protein
MKRACILIALVIVQSSASSVVLAYATSGAKWPQPGSCGSDCLGTPLTITYSYQNMFDGGIKMPNGQPLSNALIKGSIEEALRLWSSVVPINFVEVADDGLPYGTSTQFGQIRFRHYYINGPDPAVGVPIAKINDFLLPGPDYGGDVEFDDSDPWQEVGTLHEPDILGAAIHEIGHALGLAHSTEIQPNAFWTWKEYDSSGQIVDHQEPKGATVMYYIHPRFSGIGTGSLFQDDIDGIRSIYGAGVGSVTPLGTKNCDKGKHDKGDKDDKGKKGDKDHKDDKGSKDKDHKAEQDHKHK